MALKFGRSPTREEVIANDPLGEFFVWWDDLDADHVQEFEECLVTAETEADLQSLFTRIPILLVQHLGGGHGRWVLPQKRLGSEYITDFVIGERNSTGSFWHAVELESPKARMFTKSGNPSSALTHAVRQVQDWRAWLQRNQNYASRDRNQGGLGLSDITATVPGLILIGRRADTLKSTLELRRQMSADLNIAIHTYDFLYDSAYGRLPSTQKRRKK